MRPAPYVCERCLLVRNQRKGESVMKLRNYVVASVSIVGLLSLAACGGGGQGSVMPDPDPTVTIAQTIQIRRGNDPTVTVTLAADPGKGGTNVGNTFLGSDDLVAGYSRGTPRVAYGFIEQKEDVENTFIFGYFDRRTEKVSRFEYLRYGVWARIAPEVGGNAVGDYRYDALGGGYVVDLPDRRTRPADIPASGTATYTGDFFGFTRWNDGEVVRANGVVDMTADFANASMTVNLGFLLRSGGVGRFATLSGSIQGSTFAGTNLEYLADSSRLQAQGATGSMTGGFYGPQAPEAGGVFEIVGGRAQNPGRIVGAFGGEKDN